MSTRAARLDTGAGVSFLVSAVIHLAVFLLLAWTGQLVPPQLSIQETYYVDMVTLPTAAPDSGSPAPEPPEPEPSIAPPAPSPPRSLPPPAKTAPRAVSSPVKLSPPQEPAESESEFDKRMANIASKSEAQRAEAVLQKLQTKVKSAPPKVGVPAASGAEAGVRYVDFIKSRLEDALKQTSSYTTKSPEIAVRMTIAADGKLARIKIERSSGDATFELAVRRAIDLASEKFTPPPTNSVFENGFVFRPKGIASNTNR